jgi:hypothetical protein
MLRFASAYGTFDFVSTLRQTSFIDEMLNAIIKKCIIVLLFKNWGICMDAEVFWKIIGNYNQQTWVIQIAFMIAITLGITFAFIGKYQWLLKIVLGLANIFIGIVFFIIFGTEPIQFFFASPLFISAGILFLWEGYVNKQDTFIHFNKFQWLLFIIVLLYPVASIILGNSFPQMVVYIMPCPLISLCIVMYSGYTNKNKVLLVLLMLWGLTGIKSFFFNALEDTILLICSLYSIRLLIFELKNKKKAWFSS